MRKLNVLKNQTFFKWTTLFLKYLCYCLISGPVRFEPLVGEERERELEKRES